MGSIIYFGKSSKSFVNYDSESYVCDDSDDEKDHIRGSGKLIAFIEYSPGRGPSSIMSGYSISVQPVALASSIDHLGEQ